MIEAFRSWLRRKFPPTIAHVHQEDWDTARRERQHAPFVIDRSNLFAHGIDER